MRSVNTFSDFTIKVSVGELLVKVVGGDASLTDNYFTLLAFAKNVSEWCYLFFCKRNVQYPTIFSSTIEFIVSNSESIDSIRHF